jgi:hypothetical protein
LEWNRQSRKIKRNKTACFGIQIRDPLGIRPDFGFSSRSSNTHKQQVDEVLRPPFQGCTSHRTVCTVPHTMAARGRTGDAKHRQGVANERTPCRRVRLASNGPQRDCGFSHKSKFWSSGIIFLPKKNQRGEVGGGIRCNFKGETDTIITRKGSRLFGRVGRVLGYNMQLHVILHVRDEPEQKLMPFLDPVVLNVDGAWPILSVARHRLGSQLLVLKGQYRGLMGRVITLTLKLDVSKREVTLKWVGDAGAGYGGWGVD